MREALSRHYLGQLGFYAKGLGETGVKVSQMGFIVVQSVAPHDVMCIELSTDAVDFAFGEADDALTTFAEWKGDGAFDEGVAPEVVTMSLPPWARRGRPVADTDTDAGF